MPGTAALHCTAALTADAGTEKRLTARQSSWLVRGSFVRSTFFRLVPRTQTKEIGRERRGSFETKSAKPKEEKRKEKRKKEIKKLKERRLPRLRQEQDVVCFHGAVGRRRQETLFDKWKDSQKNPVLVVVVFPVVALKASQINPFPSSNLHLIEPLTQLDHV